MRQLIANALIVTGERGAEPFGGDVLIDGNRIVHLGAVPPAEAATADRRIEADGRVLAPGFIDTHNHGALGGTRIGDHGIPVTCELAVRAGVTKRICGVDGLSPAPVAAAQRHEYATQLAPLDGRIPPGAPPDPASLAQGSESGTDGPTVTSPAEAQEWPWTNTAGFLDWHKGRSVTDMGLHLGHSAVRRVVMGNLDRTADDSQIRDMAEVVRSEARHTLGLSTGLVYNPAVYSDKREITALVRAFNDVKPGALYPHLRSESDEILGALDEVITAAIDGGGAYCNEHSKIAGKQNWHKYSQVADRLKDASASVAAIENMYPWPAGSTTGDAIFPPEMRAGSREEFLARLASPQARAAAYLKIRDDTTSWDNFVGFCGGLEGIQIAGVGNPDHEALLGKRLGDVARQAGHADLNSAEAYDAVFDFFLANRGEVGIISHYGNDALVERFFRRPTMAICTDGLAPGPGQKPHPRSLGAFPKALRMARELGIGLAEIVHRLAVMPCEFMGLPSPALRPGGDASMVLFHWETVRETNTFEDPLTPPAGIDAVWVHGELVNHRQQILIPQIFPGRHLLTPPTNRT